MDIFSIKKRSQVMSNVKSKGSKIEIKVKKMLRDSGLRFRCHSKTLPGKPDFYNNKLKTVIFVDSCFWHGCRYHGSQPKTNEAFWLNKIDRNKRRDREINSIYKEKNWHVIRIWEHTLKSDEKTSKIMHLLKRNIDSK